MTHYFVTGATGTIGAKVLKYLQQQQKEVYWGSRKRTTDKPGQRYFDFENHRSCSEALRDIDVLFLMRPPQLSDQAIIPVIDNAVLQGVQHIVFMSVQGAENMPFIPHAKIEKHIQHRPIAYTFLRPGYFMENLTGALKTDVQTGTIYLPAGKAHFAWTHGDDIALAAAKVMTQSNQHKAQAYTLTGKALLNFDEACACLRQYDKSIRYKDSDWFSFYKRRQSLGDSRNFILIMGAIHYLQRFQKTQLSPSLETLIQNERPVSTLIDFIEAHRGELFLAEKTTN